MALLQIVYLSKTEHQMTATELAALAKQSAERNKQHGVTGVLMHVGGYFMQLIEGETDEVDHLYANIEHDHRHLEIHLLLKRPIKQRNFPNWNMGLVNLEQKEMRDATREERINRLLENLHDPYLPFDMLLEFITPQ